MRPPASVGVKKILTNVALPTALQIKGAPMSSEHGPLPASVWPSLLLIRKYIQIDYNY